MLNRIFLVWEGLFSYYRIHKAQAVFLITGISLGVAMFLATLLISIAANEAFDSAQRMVSGEVVAEIKPANGSPHIPESLYRELRFAGIDHLLPVTEGTVQYQQKFIHIQGVDLFPLFNSGNSSLQSDQGRRKYLDQFESLLQESSDKSEDSENPLFRFFFPPYIAVTSQSYAHILNLSEKSEIVTTGGILPPLKIVDDDSGLGYTILCDLKCAQEILNKPNQLTSIVFSQLSDKDQHLIQSIIAGNARLVILDKQVSNSAFTQAFLLNLKGIGFLAFLVGCFIAFNAARFSVVQRQQLVRQLRMCGASITEVLFAFFTELAVWSLLASVTGCFLGSMIATVLLPGVGMTLNEIFFFDNPLRIGNLINAWYVALMLSVLATMISLARPFQILLQTPVVGRSRQAKIQIGYPITSILILSAGASLTAIPDSHTQLTGLIVSACWFSGVALLVPVILKSGYRHISSLKWLKSFPVLHWTFNEGKNDLEHSSIAMMACCTGIAASIGVMTMVVSFEHTFNSHLDEVLSESLYLRLDKSNNVSLNQALKSDPRILYSYQYYREPAIINGEKGFLRSLSNHALRHHSVSQESASSDWQSFHSRQGILVNQAAALQLELQPGDPIEVSINKEKIHTQVLGIYYSYGSLIPVFLIDEDWLRLIWPSLESYRTGIYLHNEGDLQSLIPELVSKYNLNRTDYTNPQDIKLTAQRVFQQTFDATRLLTTTILLIASIGVFCAAYTSQLAKGRQFTLVRILGVDQRQILISNGIQFCFALLLVSLIALPLGLLIAWTSINIVLRYSFGWYFPMMLDWGSLSGILAIGFLTAVTGALLPHLIQLTMRRNYSDMKAMRGI